MNDETSTNSAARDKIPRVEEKKAAPRLKLYSAKNRLSRNIPARDCTGAATALELRYTKGLPRKLSAPFPVPDSLSAIRFSQIFSRRRTPATESGSIAITEA